MIKEFFIEGLYGRKDEIKLIFNEKLTIIVGKNGCGKTSILNIINTILNENYKELHDYNFKYAHLNIDDYYICIKKYDESLYVHRCKNKKEIKEYKQMQIKKFLNLKTINIKIYKNNKINNSYDFLDNDIFWKYDIENEEKNHVQRSNVYFPTYRRTEKDLSDLIISRFDSLEKKKKNYYNNKNNIVIGINNNDLISLINETWIDIVEKEKNIINELLSEMFLKIIEVKTNPRHIELDRIDIGKFNKDIKAMFDKTKLSNNFDSCHGVIDKFTKDIQNAALRDEAFRKGNILHNIDPSNIDPSNIDEEISKLMSEFDFINNAKSSINIVKDIIDVFDYKNIQLEKIKFPLKNIESILSKFLYPKIANFENGKLIFSSEGEILTFKDLSAGEKQLVTLLIHIGLGVDRNGIVIIDEPEISLHINWQRELISNLLICREDIQYIMATHSPYILNDFEDYIVQMGDLGDE